MSQEDKYPPETGRRRFVKGMVGSSAASSVATGGALAVDVSTNQSGVDGGSTEFVGIANVDGPAPRGMPLIPVEIEDGFVKGRYPTVVEKTKDEKTFTSAEEELGGFTYSVRWFQFCGMEEAEGLAPEADQDEFFRVGGGYPWQQEIESGAKLRLDHLEDYREWDNGVGTSGLGKPAKVTWRSQGENVTNVTVIVLRSPEVEKIIAGEGEYGRLPASIRTFVDAATEENCLAWLDKCTHFCCVPRYKADGSAEFDAEDMVYCNCHQSVYDPFTPRANSFVARPRPE